MRHRSMPAREPAPVRETAPGRREPLPAPPGEASVLSRLLAARRSCRELASRRLTPLEVGALLWAGQGITSPDGLRTAPSAGALYPTTLSLADDRAVWRYAPRGHALALVRPGDARAGLAAAALGQEVVAEAPATIAVSADPAVLAARYGSRSDRYCALEAGHVAQNVLLQAAALGLAAVPVGAFDDDAVRAILELRPEHLVLYLLPVGAPRAGRT
jgi:SagB-type dehydrogenase family enzyme